MLTALLSPLLVQAPAGLSAVTGPPPARPSAGPSVRITSPLGRSGASGSIRIVAQIQAVPRAGARTSPLLRRRPAPADRSATVRRTPSNGPTRIRSNAARLPWPSPMRSAARSPTRVVLEPFDIVEEAQVTSVLVEASVQDKHGRFVKSSAPERVQRPRGRRAANPRPGPARAVGATFALLIDSSASMSRRLDFVQRTAAALADYMTPLDRSLVAPFSKGLLAMTGPTDDRATVADAIRAIRSSGGTAILDSLVQLSRSFPGGRDAARGDPDYRWLRREQYATVEETLDRSQGGAGDGLRGRDWRRGRDLPERREGAAAHHRGDRRTDVHARDRGSAAAGAQRRWPTRCRTGIC